jgi:hypothetical protein
MMPSFFSSLLLLLYSPRLLGRWFSNFCPIVINKEFSKEWIDVEGLVTEDAPPRQRVLCISYMITGTPTKKPDHKGMLLSFFSQAIKRVT